MPRGIVANLIAILVLLHCSGSRDGTLWEAHAGALYENGAVTLTADSEGV